MIRAIGALVLVGIVVALGMAAPSFWSLDPDAAAYVRLARSLADTGTYALDGIPHGKYPPGLPLMLSWLTESVQSSYATMHMALVGFLALGVLASAGVLRKLEYSDVVIVAIALATAFSQTFFELSVRYLRTEVLFFALSTLSLLAMLVSLGPRRGAEGDGECGPSVAATLLGGLLMVAAIATRLAGVTLLVVPAWALLRHGAPRATRVHAVLLALLAVASIGAWQFRGEQIRVDHPTAVDYGGEMLASEPRDLTKVRQIDNPPLSSAAMKTRLVRNADVFARASATLLTNTARAKERLPVGLFFAALIAIGLLRLLLMRGHWMRQAVAVYALGTIALYAVWPFNQQERFYVPLLPWLLLAGGEGLAFSWATARVLSKTKALRVVIVLVALAAWVVLALQRSDHPALLGRYSNAYAGMLAALAGGIAVLAAVLHRGQLPKLPLTAALVVPLLFALPWAQRRFIEWPAHVAAVQAHVHDCGAFGPVFVHPVIRGMADVITANTTPSDVVMTDVPKMMAVLTERRCVPFVYGLAPPVIEPGEADVVYYSGELVEAVDVLDKIVVTGGDDFTLAPVASLEAQQTGLFNADGTPRLFAPTLYRVERR